MQVRDVGRRPCRWLAVLVLAGCSVPPRTGWEAQLRDELVDVAQGFDAGRAILSGFAPVSAASATPLGVGDELLFGVALERGARGRTWYLRIRVVALEVDGGKTTWARIRVEAFDAETRPLASADTIVALSQLQKIYAACHAGHRQQPRMGERAVLGDDADMLELDGDDQADVMRVGYGQGACHLLFRLLKSNPVTRDILFEVIALPTLWSIVSTMRIRAGLTVDFFAAQRVDRGVYGAADRPLWSVPAVVLLNDQPALYAYLIVGPDGSPDGAAAGVFAIFGRHPTDERRRVFVQLIASHRGGADASGQGQREAAAR